MRFSLKSFSSKNGGEDGGNVLSLGAGPCCSVVQHFLKLLPAIGSTPQLQISGSATNKLALSRSSRRGRILDSTNSVHRQSNRSRILAFAARASLDDDRVLRSPTPTAASPASTTSSASTTTGATAAASKHPHHSQSETYHHSTFFSNITNEI